MLRRRLIREKVMQTLFQIDVGNISPEKALGYMFGEADLSKIDQDFAHTLVMGTLYHLDIIDGLIVRQTPDWDLKRMGSVERNILRIAVYEMMYEPEIPINVSINEAIELAKTFGSEESSAFVNGVLDQIGKSVEDKDDFGGQK